MDTSHPVVENADRGFQEQGACDFCSAKFSMRNVPVPSQ
eukprot:CAMPEP_0174840916 /NCGR_PEP_ID=MMETSP1114-20130205/8987_1 /TAXON_ID=312471 /ORGANISM="Neobodo designis, Strain CCAP 1951/1" /LENGTH=38 /DNA_ID= /DNA_START= /DNA_END= /DNA_ORIENTATION=